jgi:hypothetical protein
LVAQNTHLYFIRNEAGEGIFTLISNNVSNLPAIQSDDLKKKIQEITFIEIQKKIQYSIWLRYSGGFHEAIVGVHTHHNSLYDAIIMRH